MLDFKSQNFHRASRRRLQPPERRRNHPHYIPDAGPSRARGYRANTCPDPCKFWRSPLQIYSLKLTKPMEMLDLATGTSPAHPHDVCSLQKARKIVQVTSRTPEPRARRYYAKTCPDPCKFWRSLFPLDSIKLTKTDVNV